MPKGMLTYGGHLPTAPGSSRINEKLLIFSE